MDPVEIGNRVKELMKIKGAKRKDVADKLGVSYNTITKKLSGQREFSLNEIIILREMFDLDTNLCGNIFFNPNFNLTREKVIKKGA